MAKKQNTGINIYSLKGEVVRTVDLPPVFNTEFRPDIIKRAAVAELANRRQPYGPSPGAGMRHAVTQWGKGRGTSRVQRLTQGNKAAESPNNMGGRRAWPPKVEKDWSKKVNHKERLKARMSALAALSDGEIVKMRGHQFDEKLTMPVIVEDDLEKLSTTKEVMEALESIGLDEDVERAKAGRNIRAGRGKMRGRKYKSPRGILIVVSDKEAPLFLGAKNLPGVEVVDPSGLNTGVLAPGGDAGRLAVFSESALKKVGEW